MFRRLLFVLLLASCGRINFDAVGVAGDSGQIGDASSDADQSDATVLPDDLVFYFDFEGPVTLDRTRAHSGTCTNCPTAAAGRIGRGADFDGSQCIFIPDSSALRLSVFTFAAWAKTDSQSGPMVVYGRPLNEATTSENTREIYLQSEPRWLVGMHDGQALGVVPSNSTEWHHLAGAFDGSNLTMYFDGSLVDTRDMGPSEYTDGDERIGCDFDFGSPASFFTGQVDELRLYSRELSAAEVAQLAAM